MASPEVPIRPFISLGGIYGTGLGGVKVDPNGNVEEVKSAGALLTWGVSGSKGWRHTKLGVSYRGSFDRYFKGNQFNSLGESLLLGLTQQLSRHTYLSIRENAGIFSRDDGGRGLQQTVPFDPATTYVPTTDYFDNRTYYSSTQADLRIQKSNRLSFDLGGDAYITRRSSKALYGNTGVTARADVAYRITRHATLGASYSFSHYWFTHLLGGTDVHTTQGTFAVQLRPTVEFSAAVGFLRAETVFVEAVPVPAEIALLLGITSGSRIVDSITYHPNTMGRLSKTLHHSVVSVYGGQGITPGNGLFLTSTATTAGGNYGYTGLRRWSFNLNSTYTRSHAYGYLNGDYKTTAGTLSVSRALFAQIHVVATAGYRKYGSESFSRYNRSSKEASLSIGWTPGDIPLRVW